MGDYKFVLYFFIGTEAELMKVFPVIQEAKRRNIEFRIISNGQNIIKESPFLELINGGIIDIDLSLYSPKIKSLKNHLVWFIRTEMFGKRRLSEEFNKNLCEKPLFIVHGDTLSTVMGARIAKKLKIPYVHIESGYRSYNFLSPFPEELDRLYSSQNSVINFTIGEMNTKYASDRFKGKAIDTIYNTGLETLFYAIDENRDSLHHCSPEGKFFMFMLHRQENLMNGNFINKATKEIIALSEKIPCVFIYHEQTKAAMEKANVYEDLINAKNISVLPRQSYLDFIKLVNSSEFVITDGCGNQQEFYYLGKPYLIMRTHVEKASEGLNYNAKVFKNDFSNILKFYEEYHEYTKDRIKPVIMPSKIIMDSLEIYFEEQNN